MNGESCSMSIRVEQVFTIKCLNKPMKLYISADDYSTAYLLGDQYTGNNQTFMWTYTISSVGIACRKFQYYQETQITLRVDASNKQYGVKCGNGNGAGVFFAITTDDCPCATRFFYNPDNCLCQSCQSYLPGCIYCNTKTICLACDSKHILSSNLCQPCSQYIQNCAACSNTTNCLQCSSGYVSMTGCIDCVLQGNACPNCQTTLLFQFEASTGKCVCQPGYGVGTDNLCKSCPLYIQNCATCSNTTTCTQCSPGYIPMIGCIDCVLSGNACPNCQTTLLFESDVSTGICVCQAGYVLNTANLCKPCTQYIQNCATCSNTTTCTQCSPGYIPMIGCIDCVLSGNACPNCQTTLLFQLEASTGKCICQPGYGLGTDNRCKSCPLYIQNCATCSNTTTCTQCSLGFSPMIGCIDCIMPGNACPNCQTTLLFQLEASTGKCICQPGYGLGTDNRCKSCPLYIQNCATCSNTTTCTQCSPGYIPMIGCIDCVLSGNACPNCQTTLLFESDVSTGICVCQAGYVLNTANLCKPCTQYIQNCATCSNTTTCTQCSPGYIPMIGCIDCVLSGNACPNCQTTLLFQLEASTGKCICQPGYGLGTDNRCKSCPLYIQNCATCSNTTTCTQCSLGFSPMIGCIDCIMPGNACPNCQTTLLFQLEASTGKCICQPGYGLGTDNRCKSCPLYIQNCATCSNTTTCTQCSPGYIPMIGCIDCVLSGNACPNCQTTLLFESDVSTGICVCQAGYVLNTANLCKPCTQYIQNCATCSNTTTCTQCSPGYIPMIGCIDCVLSGNACPNCQTTLLFESDVSTGICVCQAGYVLNTANLCKPCTQYIQNCATCSNTTTCTQCSPGYIPMIGCIDCVLSGNACPNCQTTLLFQLEASTGKCICQPGYGLGTDNRCKSCPLYIQNCATCSNTTTCTQCSLGFSPMIGCIDCIMPGNACPNCQTTLLFQLETSTGKCICQPGYGLGTDNRCKSCPLYIQNCATCSNTTTCTQCSPGYIPMIGCIDCVLSGDACPNCQTTLLFESDVSTGICVCQAGYVLNTANLCKPCTQYIQNCATCSNTTTCTQCSPGYIPMVGCIDCVLSGNACPNCQTTLLFQLEASTGKCICQAGYGLGTDNRCKSCPLYIQNCATCSNTTTCTQCSLGFSPMIGCIDCIMPGNACPNCQTTLLFQLETSTGKCICQPGYGLGTDNRCKSCPLYIQNCATCSNTTTCTQCSPGYIPMIGCIDCVLSGDACPNCQTTLLFESDVSTGICVCQAGYVLNTANLCKPCTQYIQNCATCSNTTTCTQCSPGYIPMVGCIDCVLSGNACPNCQTTLLFQLEASTGKCICQAGYGLGTDNRCKSCPLYIQNCATCSNTTTCTQCSLGFSPMIGCIDCIMPGNACPNCQTTLLFQLETSTGKCICQPGYGLGTDNRCKSCPLYIQNCATCSNTTTCTQCSPGYIPMIGCIDCVLSGDACPNCQTTLLFESDVSTGICVCQAGYVLNTANLCKPCTQYIQNCATCSNTTTCTQCSPGYIPMVGCIDCVLSGNACPNCQTTLLFQLEASTGKCICQAGYGLGTDNRCESCPLYIQNCATCSNTTTCTQCILGYSPFIPYECSAVCGDSLLRGPEVCDDGNILTGDGCSPTCLIQQDFLCDTTVQPSQCTYTQPLLIHSFNVSKNPSSNSVTFTFKLSDNWRLFKQVDFSKIISSNGSLSILTKRLTFDGVLTIEFELGQNLEGKDIQFSLNPALSNFNIFRGTPTSTFLVSRLSSPNNVAINVVSVQLYSTQNSFDIAFKVGLGLSYIIFFLGMQINQVIVIELFGVWQAAFLSMSTIQKAPMLLSPIMNLTAVNGVNLKFDFEKGAVPQSVASLNYRAAFLANCNYMIIFVIVNNLAGLYALVLAALRPAHSERYKGYARKLLLQSYVFLVSFSSMNIGFSAGLEFVYNRSTVGISCAVICLLLPASAIVLLLTRNKTDFGEFVTLFRSRDCTKQRYFAVAILFRVTIGLMLSLLNELEVGTILVFYVGIFFTFYQWGSMPFKKAYHNYRTVITQLAVMSGLFIGMFYSSMKGNTPIEVRNIITAPAYLFIFLLFLSITISMIVLLYETKVQLCESCQQQNVIENRPLISVNTEAQPIRPETDVQEIRKDLNLNSIMIIEQDQ